MMMEGKVVAAVVCLLGSCCGRSEGRDDEEGGGDVGCCGGSSLACVEGDDDGEEGEDGLLWFWLLLGFVGFSWFGDEWRVGRNMMVVAAGCVGLWCCCCMRNEVREMIRMVEGDV